MKSRIRQRRGTAAAAEPLPPWFTSSAPQRTRAGGRSRSSGGASPAPDDDIPTGAPVLADDEPELPPDPVADAAGPPSARGPSNGAGAHPGGFDGLLTHSPRAPADHHLQEPTDANPFTTDEPPESSAGFWPDQASHPASDQPHQPLPAGQWTGAPNGSGDLWIPGSVTTPAAESGTELAAARPADRNGRRVRTTVDRPVAALRPVAIDEARQLAECFALDYMSCDEDDPGLRQLALGPYLSRRADALLGWPTERAGLGRQRAVHARAGECLVQGRWVTVDVSVLVEIYERTDPGPAERPDPPPERPALPPAARWSAVPAAHAPGWVCAMTVWHRLGIPVRRHDAGDLVVELFTVSEPES